MANSRSTNTLIKIISYNIQGLKSPVKRLKVFQIYHSLKSNVLLLQKTHFPISYKSTFIHQNYPQFFLANAENKTKGVAICFSKCLNLSPSRVLKDPEGRHLLVVGTIDGESYTYVSYYTPNKGQAKFLESLTQSLQPHFEGTVISWGNSNIAFDFSEK